MLFIFHCLLKTLMAKANGKKINLSLIVYFIEFYLLNCTAFLDTFKYGFFYLDFGTGTGTLFGNTPTTSASTFGSTGGQTPFTMPVPTTTQPTTAVPQFSFGQAVTTTTVAPSFSFSASTTPQTQATGIDFLSYTYLRKYIIYIFIYHIS